MADFCLVESIVQAEKQIDIHENKEQNETNMAPVT